MFGSKYKGSVGDTCSSWDGFWTCELQTGNPFLKREAIGRGGSSLKHLKKWSTPKKVKIPLSHIGSLSYIMKEPHGSVLILAPWNYPFQLQLAPLIGAISAGNCAVLKLSELTRIKIN
ncbi:hypothetical protein DS031_03365 [Bacillus taeanensis]|uniref:Aldehyde dehydrogenase domain-containing protein n=1 Tax=Bacillus taeanensis TaxID=273032 RepID=A0A366Y3T4_9BACI|nr:hypothetical protein DS031_03365 [Bacillus taeanensis]